MAGIFESTAEEVLRHSVASSSINNHKANATLHENITERVAYIELFHGVLKHKSLLNSLQTLKVRETQLPSGTNFISTRSLLPVEFMIFSKQLHSIFPFFCNHDMCPTDRIEDR